MFLRCSNRYLSTSESAWKFAQLDFLTKAYAWCKLIFVIANFNAKRLLGTSWNVYAFLVADTQLYKSLCPSVRWSVTTSWKVWKRAFLPLPTRPQLVLAVYPALLTHNSSVDSSLGILGGSNVKAMTTTAINAKTIVKTQNKSHCKEKDK